MLYTYLNLIPYFNIGHTNLDHIRYQFWRKQFYCFYTALIILIFLSRYYRFDGIVPWHIPFLSIYWSGKALCGLLLVNIVICYLLSPTMEAERARIRQTGHKHNYLPVGQYVIPVYCVFLIVGGTSVQLHKTRIPRFPVHLLVGIFIQLSLSAWWIEIVDKWTLTFIMLPWYQLSKLRRLFRAHCFVTN